MSAQKITRRVTADVTRREWGALLFDLSGTKPGATVRILISHENGDLLRKLEIKLPSLEVASRWILYFPPITNSKKRVFILDLESSHEIALIEDHGHPYNIISINPGKTMATSFESNSCDRSSIVPYGGRFDDRLNPFRKKTDRSNKLSDLTPSWEQQSLSHSRVVSRLGQPKLSILLPSLLQKDFSGGPNTALIIALLLARRGVPVDVISTSSGKDKDEVIEAHLNQLLPNSQPRLPIKYFDGHGSNYSFIGEDDLIMATAWWTARRAQEILPGTKRNRFLYLIQDYEPLLYDWSDRHSMALETYEYDFIPIINSRTLAEYFFSNRPGRFKEQNFRDNALVFEPVINRRNYFPLLKTPDDTSQNKKTILFYARPSAPRNLFKMGLAAIASIIARRLITSEEWQVKLIGDTIEPIDLGSGFTLTSIPWMGFEEYCKTVRESSVGLSLMLSPHPSYPPLEMAASGLKVVTTIYESKRPEDLTSISRNLIPVKADEVSIAEGLIEAIRQSHALTGAGGRLQNHSSLPTSWETELEPIVKFIHNCIHSHTATTSIPAASPVAELDQESYAPFKRHHLEQYDKTCTLEKEPCLLSVVTSAYNTSPTFLHDLADSLLKRNDYDDFEWVLLDNGSDSPEAMATLNEIAKHPKVRFFRVEENLGIIGGMSYLLERANGRYYLPTDSDDIISDNGLRIMAWHIKKEGFPPLLFSDEDILVRETFLPGYMKPGWDPVLFLHSCYIAHWCAIDRKKALSLGAYSDSGSEGCHDWDTFLRFTEAGHDPVHVPALLYSWRVHPQSAAGGNFDCKSYVEDSHVYTLNRHLKTLPCADKFSVERSPLLPNTPDWYFKRSQKNAPPMLTLLIRDGSLPVNGSGFHSVAGYPVSRVEPIDIKTPIGTLHYQVEKMAEMGGLVHFLSDQVTPVGDDWPWEVISMMELFPDTAMVGGRVYNDRNELIAGGEYFGFGGDCQCPDLGRHKTHPGYQAQLLKQHSVSAVSTMFSVVDASLLLSAMAELPKDVPISLPFLGAWLGVALRRMGKRVVYSPFLEGKGSFSWAGLVTPEERSAFSKINGDLIAKETLYHPELSLKSPYQFATIERNRAFHESSLSELARSTKEPDMLQLTKFTGSEDWTQARVAARKNLYDVSYEKTYFSINTTVYDTPPLYIKALQMSLMAQDYPHFEWNILDNGSSDPEVIEAVRDIGKADPRFHSFRVEKNIHIIGGNRYLLERSQNQYIAPVDSDDLLHPDALKIMACFIERHKQPTFLYSDEEKFANDGGGSEPILRVDFAPLTAHSYCYTAHLSCFKREEALRLSVYGDSYANGSHDWDTFFRFIESGVIPIHVPEVLYCWRSTPTSTASSISTKDFALTSQQSVLQESLRRRKLDKLFTVEAIGATGQYMWSYDRKKTDPQNVEIIYHLHTGGPVAHDNFEKLCLMIKDCKYPAESLNLTVVNRMDIDFAQSESFIPYTELKHHGSDEANALNHAMSESKAGICIIIDDTVAPESKNWLWNIVGLFELDPIVTLASGKTISPGNKILTAPRVAGLGGHFAMPYIGLDNFEANHAPLHIVNCTAIAMPWVAVKRKEFLDLGGFTEPISGSGFGDIEASLKVIRAGKRIGFNGTIVFRSAVEEAYYGPDISSEKFIKFIRDNADLIMDDPNYHPACSLRPSEFGLINSVERRDYMLSRFLQLPVNRWTESNHMTTTARYDFSSRLTQPNLAAHLR
ncbi:hypothetical protein MNBD_NITROSPINAE01-1449 [hydrothermal vent metagenome]|uniref:Glycosyltransferase 2-like domain-containing protein n=1 Tax=hydrothermal vent metagenome TaxID=652676 RepID=A0A3B1BC36_9ZZZZ